MGVARSSIAAASVLVVSANRLSSVAHSQAVPIELLKQTTTKALVNEGYSAEDSKIVCDTLLFAELRNNNQGLIKLATGALKPHPKSADITIAKETPVSVQLLGGQRIGMVVLSKAVEMAVNKAKTTGVCIVGCSDYSSATGALGTWARKIADEGMIGIVMSQCPEMVAPHGSYEAIFGTNPLAVGIPTTPRPQVLDMATSAIAYYGVKTAEKEGLSIPDDVAYNKNGESTTDPKEALEGAIRVFDRSFKGSHLALVVELLAGAWPGASMTNKTKAENWGSLVIAIDPSILGSVEEFQARANEMCVRVKEAKKLPGVKEMILPGERGDAIEAENIRKGSIDVSSKVFNDLLKMANAK